MSELSHTHSSCPYLGLPDDSRTSLAYPSLWNHCYRANHPAPIELAHQSRVCLCSFDQCPVYKAGERSSMPAGLPRGLKLVRHNKRPARNWIRILLLTSLAVFMAAGILLARSVASLRTRMDVYGLLASPAHDTMPTVSGPQLTADTPAIATNYAAAVVQTTITQLQATETRGHQSTTTQQTTVTPTSVCGHQLDVPFGEDVKLVIHRVLQGENLTKLAGIYQTTEQSIVAVNYYLPVPVWVDRVVVIPIGIENTGGLPLFETYQQEDEISMEDLAGSLNVDPQALQKYNGFVQHCSTYSGWLLVPRATDASLK